MDGEIISNGEMKDAREHAAVLQAVVNNNPSLRPQLVPAMNFLLHLGYKAWP